MYAIRQRIIFFSELLLGSFVYLPWAVVGTIALIEYIVEKVLRDDPQTKEWILSFLLFNITDKYFLYALVAFSIVLILENAFLQHQKIENLVGSLEKDRPLLKITRERFDCFMSLPHHGDKSGGEVFLDNADSTKMRNFVLYNLGDQNAINIKIVFSFSDSNLFKFIKDNWPFEKIEYDDGSIDIYTEYSIDRKEYSCTNIKSDYDNSTHVHIIKSSDKYEVTIPTELQRMYNIFSQVVSFNEDEFSERKIDAQKTSDILASGDPQLLKEMFSEREKENLSLMPDIKIDVSYESADGRRFTDVKIQRSLFKSFMGPFFARDNSGDKEKYFFVPAMGTVSFQDEEAHHGSYFRHVANLE